METVYETIDDKILNESFTNIFRPGYVKVAGVTMPERFQEFQETIENWTVHNDDVWVCSFPKTGTTWTQEMVWLIMNDLNFAKAERSLAKRFPFLDHTILFDYRKVMENNKDFNPPTFVTDSVNYVGDQQRPRFIKTHLPWNLLPKEIQSGTKKPKIIYVSRNPKDTCVSYFHHCRLIEGYKGDFKDFCQLFFSGKVVYGPFWGNVLQFWERRRQSNVLFLQYEDLKKDLPTCIRKVAGFLDKNIKEEQLRRLTEHLSFESMKNNKAVNYEAHVELNKKYKLVEHQGEFMRSGTVGGYKAEMSKELIEKFDSWIKEQAPDNKLEY